jgi:23S rRNA (cytidine1920-2'-O)/16S rRNA (cytidine1409-2'-O)-methyltransferase
MVARALVPSRSKARDLILRGKVSVGARVVDKPAHLVGPGDQIVLAPGVAQFVSRGAEKLAAALETFNVDPRGRVALDIGASTGGFTEILLMRGARRVYAVDVGHDQLHARLREDARVISCEGRDARYLDRGIITEPIEAIVADVSFISLTKALPVALDLADAGAWLVALVKPQFEAGRAAIGKGGIVGDPDVHTRVLDEVCHWLAARPGWVVAGTCVSPIEGGDGNREFFIAGRKT